MNRMTIAAVGLTLAAALTATPASALNARSFVSGHGNDANICTFAAPCRTFAAAYAKTNAGGEISVLDPAGYGPLTITTALSIVNDGVGESSIVLITAGNAITISAGVNDAVSLRGVTIDGSGTPSTNGIVFNSGASLTVANCVIRHLTHGIEFFPNASSGLSVSNSLMADSFDGILVEPSGSGAVTIMLNRVEANSNSNNGIEVDGDLSTGTVMATVSDSVAAGNNGAGIIAFTVTSHAATTLMVVRSVAANNVFGLVAEGPGATIRVDNSTVTGNGNGWFVNSSGILKSYGNNSIDGNTANETAPPSVALK
jgi:hypothetical protein